MKFDSQDKTHSVIEKMTFSASESGVGKKLLFQSLRCGLSLGFWKKIECAKGVFQVLFPFHATCPIFTSCV